MGKAVLIVLVSFVLIIGVVYTVLKRNQVAASDSVIELYHNHQARRLANTFVKEGIALLRENVSNNRAYDHGVPPHININQEGEIYTVLAVATVDGITFQSEVVLESIPGTFSPGRFEPGLQEQFFLLTQDAIELIRPHPNFNSALFQHNHNIRNQLSYEVLSEHQNIIYNTRPMRFASTAGNVINTSIILYSTEDIFLHGTIEALPGVEVILISEKRILGGKSADNNITNPVSGALIGPGVRLYSRGGLGTEGDGSLRVKDGSNNVNLTINHPIYSNQIPSSLTDLINSSGGGGSGSSNTVGRFLSWKNRPIATI